MRTLHKHGRQRRALAHLRLLVRAHRRDWGEVEHDAYETHDPQVLVLVASIAGLMDCLDDRLDDLLEGLA